MPEPPPTTSPTTPLRRDHTPHGRHRRSARDRQGAPRAHRRRHDGLQERARGDRRRHRQGRRPAPREGAWRPPPRRPAATPAKGSSSSYIHAGGRLGVLIEVNCETDFVARNDDFQKLVRDLAMQVAGLAPEYVDRRVDPGRGGRARSAPSCSPTRSRRRSPRPSARRSSRASCSKWYQQVVLYEQPFRDTDQTVGQLITDAIARIGENIRVRRFTRYAARGGAVSDAPAARARAARRAPRGERATRASSSRSPARRCWAPRAYGVDPAVSHLHRRRRSRRSSAAGVEVAIVVGGGNIFRGLAAAAQGHGPRHRRLHGHARHRHQRPRPAGRAREERASPRAS